MKRPPLEDITAVSNAKASTNADPRIAFLLLGLMMLINAVMAALAVWHQPELVTAFLFVEMTVFCALQFILWRK